MRASALLVIGALSLLQTGCSLWQRYYCDRPAADERPLTGGRWAVRSLDAIPLAGNYHQPSPPWLQFSAEGVLQGHTGCNALTAHYDAQRSHRLGVGRVATTRRACGDPAFEQRLLSALSATRYYRTQGHLLQLRDAQGVIRLILEAQPMEAVK